MLYTLARLVPWGTVLALASAVVLAQILGVDLLGMAADLLKSWLDLGWLP